MAGCVPTPARPGELLAGWQVDLGVSVTGFAAHIGISRVMLSRVMNGRSAVSADMDLRLAEALGTSPGHWLALQARRNYATEIPNKKATRLRVAFLFKLLTYNSLIVVGPDRFELSTYGLRVCAMQHLPVLINVAKLYINQQLIPIFDP